MISHAVEISITGGVGEKGVGEKDLSLPCFFFCLFFCFFLFFFL